MSKGIRTRDRILSEGLDRATRSGLGSVTVGTTAAALDMSKSGLFAHFGSKDALQLAIVEKAIDRFDEKVVRPGLTAAKGLPRLRALIDGYVAWIDGDDDLPGCPFVTMVQEFQAQDGAVRDALVESQTAWRTLLATSVRDARAAGDLPEGPDPEQIAFDLIGAVLSYQVATKLLADPKAPDHLARAIDRIL